jgi:hypothetical protein
VERDNTYYPYKFSDMNHDFPSFEGDRKVVFELVGNDDYSTGLFIQEEGKLRSYFQF